MIRYLSGKIQKQEEGELILNVNGVGYHVETIKFIQENLNEETNIELYIHTLVREDSIRLFGFLRYEELIFFELLMTVSGVGPKAALTILKSVSIGDISSMIIDGTFSKAKIPGVGKKTLDKIILDLKDKELLKTTSISNNNYNPNASTSNNIPVNVISALLGLGFKDSEVRKLYSDHKEELIDLDEKSAIVKLLKLARNSI